MKQNTSQEVRDTYKLDKQLERVEKQIKNELSNSQSFLLEKYDSEMVNIGLGKSTRIKHMKILLSITRKTNKEWYDITKDDPSNLVKNIMKEFA